MTIDPTKTQFASAFDIDKIAAYSSQTDAFPTTISAGLSYSIPGSGGLTPTYTLESITNPYGKKCYPNLSWSLDGTNFYDQDDILYYYNATYMSQLTQMQAQCGCSDSTIYFGFKSEYTSTQTVYIIFAVDSPT